MTRSRLAALIAAPLVLLATSGCRDGSAGAPPPDPGGSVEQRFDDIESTLDGIESELNAP